MNTKLSFFWLTSLLLLILFLRVSALSSDSSSSDNDSDSSSSDSDSSSSSSSESNSSKSSAEDNATDTIDPYSPETIYSEIMSNKFVYYIPPGILQAWSPDQLSQVLAKSLGAAVVTTRPNEFFALDYSFIDIESIDATFFSEVEIFNSYSASSIKLADIPDEMIMRIVEGRSKTGHLNLKHFIARITELNQSLLGKLDSIFLLPHLFDFPNLKEPHFYAARGMVFNPDGTWTEKDYLIWAISMQILVHKMINNPSYQTMDCAEEVKAIILRELQAVNASPWGNWNINFFGLQDNQIIPLAQIFNSVESFMTFEDLLGKIDCFLGIDQLSRSDYETMSTDNKIIYRLLIFLALRNPGFMSESERTKMILTIVRDSKSYDLTSAELRFFIPLLLESQKCGDIIATVFRTRQSINCHIIEAILLEFKSRPGRFHGVVRSTTSVAEKIVLLRRLFDHLKTGIVLENEESFKTALLSSLSSPSPSSESSISSPSSSHFLSEDQLKSLNGKNLNRNHRNRRGDYDSDSDEEFTVPCPDKDFLNARLDIWMQNLDSSDYGEAAWRAHLSSLTPEQVEEYKQHEATLDEFVRQTFQVAHFMQQHPSVDVELSFTDSPSYGDGPKTEALEMLTRALLLPRYKIFYYNPKLLGFVPYPLLHPTIMAVLGYLNGWFIAADMPINWSFSPDYIRFLFYEEYPLQSMQKVIEHFYGPLFTNLDKLVSQYTSPLDYFPTSFHTHQPLPFYFSDITTPFDLFSPHAAGSPRHFDVRTLDFLSQVIDTSDLVDENTHRQLQLKREIVNELKDAASHEIIEHFLLGRFAFIREFFKIFNTHARQYITADFYKEIQDSFNPVITVQDLIQGFKFDYERCDIQVLDALTGDLLTPRETLTRVLESFDPKLLKTFYWFCTGCISFPFGGLDKNPIEVKIQQQQNSRSSLPSASTCFRTLRLDIRPTLAENIDTMRTALLESSGYHQNG